MFFFVFFSVVQEVEVTSKLIIAKGSKILQQKLRDTSRWGRKSYWMLRHKVRSLSCNGLPPRPRRRWSWPRRTTGCSNKNSNTNTQMFWYILVLHSTPIKVTPTVSCLKWKLEYRIVDNKGRTYWVTAQMKVYIVRDFNGTHYTFHYCIIPASGDPDTILNYHQEA